MTNTKKKRTTSILIGVVAVVAIALIAAISVGAGSSGTASASISETQPVTINGTPLPPYPEQGEDSAVGMQAPELIGKSFDGTPVSITNDGIPKAILFLAHWCPHCQNEVDDLVPYLEANGVPPGTAVYAVSTSASSSRPNWPPSKWLDGLPLPTLVDDSSSSAAQAYGLIAFPFVVLVDADGTVAFRFPGEVPPENLMQALATMAQ